MDSFCSKDSPTTGLLSKTFTAVSRDSNVTPSVDSDDTLAKTDEGNNSEKAGRHTEPGDQQPSRRHPEAEQSKENLKPGEDFDDPEPDKKKTFFRWKMWQMRMEERKEKEERERKERQEREERAEREERRDRKDLEDIVARASMAAMDETSTGDIINSDFLLFFKFLLCN